MASPTLRTHFRGIPPRVLLRSRDNRPRRIPTVARNVSSSDRSGRFLIGPFDDTRTIVFDTVVTQSFSRRVLYPIKLSQRDAIRFGLSDLIISEGSNFSLLSGAVMAGVSDEFVEDSIITGRYTVVTQSRTPYREVDQYEQGPTSSFYTTGTDPYSVGPGFSAALKSKDIIKLEFPHTTRYTFSSQTASIAYYNSTTSVFTRVGSVTEPANAFANTNVNILSEPIAPGRDPTEPAANFAYDARLFGPWGSPVVTGTVGQVILNATTGGFNAPSNKFGQPRTGSALGGGILADIMGNGDFLSSSVTKSSEFAASVAGTGYSFTIGQIQQPFLVEKAVIEVPFSASTDWMNDRTTLIDIEASGKDIGGPCITFSLMREASPTHREIILSATMIPIGDYMSQSYQSVQTTVPFVATPRTAPQGFLYYGKPAAVVSGTSTGFLGTVRLETEAAVSNGFFAVSPRSVTTTADAFISSTVRAFTAFGRAMDRSPSGRSLFGKEFSLPPSENFQARTTNASDITSDIYIFEQHTTSPYIIMPNDRLILSVSKFRSVVSNPEYNVAPFGTGDRTALSASHTVAIPVGTIKLTLYGSSLREGQQVYQPRNEPLVSNAITEAIGSEIVSDQFDVAPRNVFSGSYTDVYVSGTIGSTTVDATNTKLDGRRGVKISSVKDKPNMTSADHEQTGFGGTSLKRHVNVFAANEVYFDSLVPSPDEVQSTDGADSLLFRIDVTGSVIDYNIMFPLRSNASLYGYTAYGYTAGGISGTTTIVENSKWPLGFPFEARYGSLERKFNPTSNNRSNKAYTISTAVGTSSVTNNVVKVARADSIIRVAGMNTVTDDASSASRTQSIEILQNTDPTAAVSTWVARWNRDEFEKGFYGFGDFEDSQPRWKQRDRLVAIVTPPSSLTYFHRSAFIRGWKYGLIAGRVKTSSAQFRRTHFGHFRDMLEQRLYTKFVDSHGTQVFGGPVFVRFTTTSSLDTSSSNVSFGATSSLPYFDGVVRN